ncbi:MAG TPA: ABC-2 family transporter protein [Polyangiaceae bacterium]
MSSFAKVMPTLRFLVALWSLGLRANLARRAAFAVQIGFMALNNLVFFVFWWLLFERVPNIRGYALGDVALMFGVVASGYGVAVTIAGGLRHLGRIIDEGELDGFMAQPKPTLLYALASRSQPSGAGDVLSGLGMVALSGKVDVAGAAFVLVAIAASATAFVATGTLFYSLAFWFQRTEGVARQLLELVITFALYPERLFGGAVKVLLFTLLPAAFVGYLPVRLAQAPSVATLVVMLAACGGYAALAVWVFERGLRRYCSGSRFGVMG